MLSDGLNDSGAIKVRKSRQHGHHHVVEQHSEEMLRPQKFWLRLALLKSLS